MVLDCPEFKSEDSPPSPLILPYLSPLGRTTVWNKGEGSNWQKRVSKWPRRVVIQMDKKMGPINKILKIFVALLIQMDFVVTQEMAKLMYSFQKIHKRRICGSS